MSVYLSPMNVMSRTPSPGSPMVRSSRDSRASNRGRQPRRAERMVCGIGGSLRTSRPGLRTAACGPAQPRMFYCAQVSALCKLQDVRLTCRDGRPGRRREKHRAARNGAPGASESQQGHALRPLSLPRPARERDATAGRAYVPDSTVIRRSQIGVAGGRADPMRDGHFGRFLRVPLALPVRVRVGLGPRRRPGPRRTSGRALAEPVAPERTGTDIFPKV
jgi:hypothetical protein